MAKKKRDKYYVEVVRYWEYTSYDTTKHVMTYAHPLYIVKKRKLFSKDEVVRTYWGMEENDVEKALDVVNHLNGHDFNENKNSKGVSIEYDWSKK